MSEYTGRELDIMYREAFEAGQEQGRADMAHVTAERDRLREQRDKWIAHATERTSELKKLKVERDCLREMIGTALQVIPRRYEAMSPVKKSRVIRDVLAVLGKVQEAEDE